MSFDPWWGGFSNIRMSYELAAAISVITKRTLIVPHKVYCLFLSEHYDKNSFFDVWKILDKNAFFENFDCVNYKKISEYSDLENNYHYFHNIEKVAKLILFSDEYHEWGKPQKSIKDDNFLFTQNEDQIDFNQFAKNRSGVCLNHEDKFIHFPRNLFGHFYYLVYASGAKGRNEIKNKIINGIKYRQCYFEEAFKVKNKIGVYNAIHVRRNDFLRVRKESSTSQIKNLITNLGILDNKEIPLYIATDEVDKSVFSFLNEKYKVYFLSDFFDKKHDFEKLAIDQIICAEADVFLGSKYSTYSDYINVIRGINNKKDFHRSGTNFNFPKIPYKKFPWENECADWNRLHETYWKYEEEK